jgi:hypothetical protein
MRLHTLKTWPGFFQPLVEGKKRFEYRLDDRGFAVSDILCLQEWDPDTEIYTGREFFARITFYLNRFGLPKDYCILGIEEVDDIDHHCLHNCDKFPEICEGTRDPGCTSLCGVDEL